MASLELRNQTYRIVFMHAGKKYGYSLDTGDKQTAEGLRGGVEKTLMVIEQRFLSVPAGAEVVAFVRADGQCRWVNGSPIKPNRWQPGRPEGNGDFAVIWGSGLIGDGKDTLPGCKGYIVEWSR